MISRKARKNPRKISAIFARRNAQADRKENFSGFSIVIYPFPVTGI
jgi:hypothetical protein